MPYQTMVTLKTIRPYARRIMAARRGHILLIASWRRPWDTGMPGDTGIMAGCLFHIGHIWTYI